MAIFACLESLARPTVLDASMDKGYRAMGNDRKREAEASEWISVWLQTPPMLRGEVW